MNSDTSSPSIVTETIRKRGHLGNLHIISGSGGGVGKSTIAWGLSNITSFGNADRNGSGVCLIEADFCSPKLQVLLGGGANQGFEGMNVLRIGKAFQEGRRKESPLAYVADVFRNTVLVNSSTNLNILVAPSHSEFSEYEKMVSDTVKTILFARKMYDQVYVDLGTLNLRHKAIRSLLLKATSLVMVSDSSDAMIKLTADHINATSSKTRYGGAALNPMVIYPVVNMVDVNGKKGIKALAEKYNQQLAGDQKLKCSVSRYSQLENHIWATDHTNNWPNEAILQIVDLMGRISGEQVKDLRKRTIKATKLSKRQVVLQSIHKE